MPPEKRAMLNSDHSSLDEMGARLRAYSIAEKCLCGKQTGHAGWVLCLFPNAGHAATDEERQR